ncbi:MAG: phosphotransferase enzyme family protein [bacterium]|jgi:Ser/Thr protein kinase RdoA (MazF antagonist)
MVSNQLLKAFIDHPEEYSVELFGDGLIHHTYVVKKAEEAEYILQEVNANVFKQPLDISSNLNALSEFLEERGIAPFFPLPMSTIDGEPYAFVNDKYYRLTPFKKGAHAVNFCATAEQAYQAAYQFGNFTAAFDGFDTSKLKDTISRFHDLEFRWEQYTDALSNGNPERIKFAKKEIEKLNSLYQIVLKYKQYNTSASFIKRVTHHDTKISNVLLDRDGKGLCVIDLDTVMPGLFISDVGDMCRTYLSPGNEEETDLSKVFVRKDFYDAIVAGYLEKMADRMTQEEKEAMSYSGEFILYMQALRFLTDFLNNDTYYGIRYEMNNYDRTINQLVLLDHYQRMPR